jgi:D-3-phosphoglycerate dehydrogenase / 2-oxoglutarate reductase
MKILLADANHPVLQKILTDAGFLCDAFWHLSAEELKTLLPQYEGLIIRSKFKLDAALLSSCPALKCIGRVGAGMENIDVAFAEAQGIRCLCVPEGNRDAVGEHALGMLLMLLNHLKKADAEVRQGIWLRAENRGTEMRDKTVAIIGYGNMGASFAKKLSGFDAKILVHDKYKTGFSTPCVAEATLDQIFEETDILSLHLPLTKETAYYFNADFLSRFKKPIYVVNTARGKCLDTAALVAGLQSGQVLGACLDVLEYESLSFEQLDTTLLPAPMYYLLKAQNVVLSPHIAGWTNESNERMSRLIAEKMKAHLLSR